MNGSRKWVIRFVSIFVIFTSLFWLIFYSTFIANNTLIITLRKWHQNTSWNIKKLFLGKSNSAVPFKPTNTFQVQKWMDTNVYTFYRTFVKTNKEEGFIYIKGYDNKTYIFNISTGFVVNQTDLSFSKVTITPNQDIINVDELPFTEESKIQIVWDDTRTLNQILSDYKDDKLKPLNYDSSRFFSLTKRG